jgi:hypothetical protein
MNDQAEFEHAEKEFDQVGKDWVPLNAAIMRCASIHGVVTDPDEWLEDFKWLAPSDVVLTGVRDWCVDISLGDRIARLDAQSGEIGDSVGDYCAPQEVLAKVSNDDFIHRIFDTMVRGFDLYAMTAKLQIFARFGSPLEGRYRTVWPDSWPHVQLRLDKLRPYWHSMGGSGPAGEQLFNIYVKLPKGETESPRAQFRRHLRRWIQAEPLSPVTHPKIRSVAIGDHGLTDDDSNWLKETSREIVAKYRERGETNWLDPGRPKETGT